ncbi:MAG: glycoside hydrolase family 38 C-terminal domain-containing protein [Mariniphaga sp.]
MKNRILLFMACCLLLPFFALAQQIDKREKYDVSKDKVLYTIGYAHLDTEWNWEYPTTINEYIKNTMEDNFKLLEKYPDYVFNFTGSRRYNMMYEYYPESFKKVAEYIKQGRWFISGSSVDEGEVNVSSSESVLRQVLYGNLYFKRTFNKQSYDYMLPDCFGFVATMPSVWNHAGLLGFSTQKLTWRSSNGTPFNVGVWEGPDGKGLLAALNATSYSGGVEERLDKNPEWTARMNSNVNKFGVNFDFRYYGTGDVGGAPREKDVVNAVKSVKHDDSNFKVVLTSSDQIFKDITPELREKLPTYSGDLLLTEHSAGSMTSQSFMKRANRKNELLAKSAEQLASVADWMGGASYPMTKINNSWDLILGSQFHDILPGTSTVLAYKYAWNDEFIAMNGLSEVVKNSISTIAHQMNTQTTGKAVVVYNPVAMSREDVVTAELTYSKLPVNISVFDNNGQVVPFQIISSNGNKLKLIFLAKLPSAGLSVFDVRETSLAPAQSTTLSIKDQTLENSYLKVVIDKNGDISSIYDKKALKEVLSKPASLQFQQERPTQWPAWNMDWNDRKNPPFDFMNKEVTVKIVEMGPVRVAFEVTKKGQNSSITQIISLAAGEAGKRIEVANKIDWQSKEVSLKAAFPTTVTNEMATYGLNTAAIQRTTNNDVKFEVPGRLWIDLTDRPNNYGVSILEDCKYGSDKPDNNTLRLTLMYTPKANSYVYQGSQDWGVHDVKYGIYPHTGDWAYALSPWQGEFLNNPLLAFETTKHDGSMGKEISLVKINSPKVQLMAFKKAEESDYYIVRFNELFGKTANHIAVNFPGKVVDAYEVNGQEQKIGVANSSNGALNFDMSKFQIRTFAVKLEKPAAVAPITQQSVALPYNIDVISFDKNRGDGRMTDTLAIAAELIPETIVSEDIKFKIGNTADGQNNAVFAKGQKIDLPAGDYNKVYILAAATQDVKDNLKIGSQTASFNVQDWTGWIGQHYNRKLYFNDMKVAGIANAYSKGDNIAWYANHHHSPKANDAYQYSYLYKYEFNIAKGAKSVTLPNNEKIRIFAITVAKKTNDDIQPLQPLYDDFKDSKPVELRVKEMITPEMVPMKYSVKPLFGVIDPRMANNSRLKAYLRSQGMDTVIVQSVPSTTDYADVKSGNKVSAVYYATGKSSKGKDYDKSKMDISQILDSQSGKLADTVWFDNGEGRFVLDLQKSVSIDKIDLFLNQFRARGNQLFSMWVAENPKDVTGDPKTNGWKYIGFYGAGGRGMMGATGASLKFEESLKGRYIMLLTDGKWHGNDYLKQVDVFVK